MDFKWPANRVVNRFWFKFVSDNSGMISIDIDKLKKRLVTVDEEGNEIVEREAISKEDKTELLSALKAYGFGEIVNKK